MRFPCGTEAHAKMISVDNILCNCNARKIISETKFVCILIFSSYRRGHEFTTFAMGCIYFMRFFLLTVGEVSCLRWSFFAYSFSFLTQWESASNKGLKGL